jgi:hypothetical protein
VNANRYCWQWLWQLNRFGVVMEVYSVNAGLFMLVMGCAISGLMGGYLLYKPYFTATSRGYLGFSFLLLNK